MYVTFAGINLILATKEGVGTQLGLVWKETGNSENIPGFVMQAAFAFAKRPILFHNRPQMTNSVTICYLYEICNGAK